MPEQNDPAAVAVAPGERRADVDARQALLATFLQEAGCEGLLVFEPENFAWLTSGPPARGVLDPSETPALYFSPEQRWLLCANVDSQRLFDEQMDGLGFQLKEWPWHWGRAQLLAGLCQGRVLASDRADGACKPIGEQLAQRRRQLSPYERTCYRILGKTVVHALEATGRTLVSGQTEREIAGQLGHRLLLGGAWPIHLRVAGDDRARRYRRGEPTDTPVQRHCILSVTASMFGLCVTASRSLCFGAPDENLRREYDAVCKVSAAYISATQAGASTGEILKLGRRGYLLSGFEHEWLACPQGTLTGRAPVELSLPPDSEEPLQAGWAVTWHASAGAASSGDTFQVAEDGAESVTPTESWAMKRVRIQGKEIVRPYLLVR